MEMQYNDEYLEDLEEEILYLNTALDILIYRIEKGIKDTCICLECLERDIKLQNELN